MENSIYFTIFAILCIYLICIPVFKYMPVFMKKIMFAIAFIFIVFTIGLMFQEMVTPTPKLSWLMMLEQKVDKDLNKNNPKQTIIINNIKRVYIYKKDSISTPYKEFEKNMLYTYEEQMNKLKNWSYLKHLPKNIDKNEFIEYLSRCQYPLYLAMIFFTESSFKTNANKGKYIGLGQHDPQFVIECGYTINEYNNSWKVQLYVSMEYIKKYVKIPIYSPEQLYAFWLNCNWSGNNVIYTHKTKLPNGRKPYGPNKNLDKNKNRQIEVVPDLKQKFECYLTN